MYKHIYLSCWDDTHTHTHTHCSRLSVHVPYYTQLKHTHTHYLSLYVILLINSSVFKSRIHSHWKTLSQKW